MRAPSFKIIALILACLLLVVWKITTLRRHDGAGVSHIEAVPAGLVGGAFSPVQHGMLGVGDWFSNVGAALFLRSNIEVRNAQLEGRLAEVEGQNRRLLRYRRENDELRKLLALPAPDSGKALAANIVGYDATDFAQRVTLDVGARQGVQAKDMVYCAYGLVGQVFQVGPVTSVVALLPDREFGVGAMTARTQAKGVILGTGNRLCQFAYLDFQADVREGDLVVTSGLVSGRGSLFPKGIVVGRVVKVERNKAYSRLEATVDPSVPLERLSAVFVRIGKAEVGSK